MKNSTLIGKQNLAATVFIAMLIAGCAATYSPPEGSFAPVSRVHSANTENLLSKARNIIASEGFAIQVFDKSGGFMSTAGRDIKLSKDEADCGTTMGINYLSDNRTRTKLAINVFVDDNQIKISAVIEGFYGPQDTPLKCISKGLIEKRFLGKIL